MYSMCSELQPLCVCVCASMRLCACMCGVYVCVVAPFYYVRKKENKDFRQWTKVERGTSECQTVLENVCLFVEGREWDFKGGAWRGWRLHNLWKMKNMWFPCTSAQAADWRWCERKSLNHWLPKAMWLSLKAAAPWRLHVKRSTVALRKKKKLVFD